MEEPSYFMPTKNGFNPFSVWCNDTIITLIPVAQDSLEYIVVVVDAFFKWVEVGVLRYLDSQTNTVWFHSEIIYRYDILCIIKSDRGTEY